MIPSKSPSILLFPAFDSQHLAVGSVSAVAALSALICRRPTIFNHLTLNQAEQTDLMTVKRLPRGRETDGSSHLKRDRGNPLPSCCTHHDSIIVFLQESAAPDVPRASTACHTGPGDVNFKPSVCSFYSLRVSGLCQTCF